MFKIVSLRYIELIASWTITKIMYIFQNSFILMVVVFAIATAAPATEAKPLVVAAPVPYLAPLITEPVVAATSSQFIARNYNGLAVSAPLIAAPSAYTAYSSSPYVATYPSAYTYSGFIGTPSVLV